MIVMVYIWYFRFFFPLFSERSLLDIKNLKKHVNPFPVTIISYTFAQNGLIRAVTLISKFSSFSITKTTEPVAINLKIKDNRFLPIILCIYSFCRNSNFGNFFTQIQKWSQFSLCYEHFLHIEFE